MEAVRERVRTGAYGPGGALPSERALAREFGTNHETANKAVAHLVAEGVLLRRRGIGTFVASSVEAGTAAAPRSPVVDVLIDKQAAEIFGGSSFHEEIVFLLQSRLAGRGIGCNIVPVRDLPDFDAYVERVDGLVISKALPRAWLDRIERARKPVVSIDFDPALPLCAPVMVEHRAVEELCRHLVGLGHRRVAFVRGPGFDAGAERRLLRFRGFMAMAEPGGDPDVVEIDPADELDPLPRELLRCTAIMAGDDFLAIKVRQGLARSRVAVPGDVSLTGYGNLSITRSLYPELTTADVDRDAFCAGVVAAIEEALGGRGPASGRAETRFFASRPVLRSSTAPPRP
jgi:DNA-binding LacI/PurR family transcriptional regulator